MKDKFFKKINMQIVNFAVVMIMAVITALSLLAIKKYAAFVGVLIFFMCFSFVNILVYVVNRKINIKTVKNLSYYLYEDNSQIGAGAITQFRLPIAFLTPKGKLIWANDELNQIFENKNKLKNLLYEFFSIKLRPQIEYNNKDKFFYETVGERSFIVYYSIDGKNYNQIRLINHPHIRQVIDVGAYACSPKNESFDCVLEEIDIS